MTGHEFREQHGDPGTWDDDEYEAYFAWTAPSTTTTTTDHDLAA
ncbi:hypothetical protein [Streptomyces longwoodensis]|nr:hypothetical protein [Streptomyces longwoodensis]MCX5001011.1 hypothetical protein [Streptomyces longwoodensis]